MKSRSLVFGALLLVVVLAIVFWLTPVKEDSSGITALGLKRIHWYRYSEDPGDVIRGCELYYEQDWSETVLILDEKGKNRLEVEFYPVSEETGFTCYRSENKRYKSLLGIKIMVGRSWHYKIPIAPGEEGFILVPPDDRGRSGLQ